MKLTHQQAIDLLGKAGVKDVELVDNESADPSYNPDEALHAIDETRVGFHRPSIEREVEEAAKIAAGGKYGGILRQQLSKLTGTPNAELKAIAKDEDAIAHALNQYKDTLSADDRTRQEAMENERKSWSEKEKALVDEWSSKLQAQVDRFNDREIDSWIADELKDAPLLSTADRTHVAKLLKNELRSQFELQYDETGKRAKVIDPATKLEARNAAGNDNFKLKEFAEKALQPYGLWATDMRGQNPAKVLEERGNPGLQKQPELNTSIDPVKAQQERVFAAPALQG